MSSPAADLARIGWVLPRLGQHAVIYPGQRERARAAVQALSGQIRKEQIWTRTG